MATHCGGEESKSEKLKVILIHGPAKYEIIFEDLSATIEELTQKVYKLTQVPKARQRLIWKGKSLTNYDRSLLETGLKYGAKILLIGKKHDPEEEKQILYILQTEKKVNQIEEVFLEIAKDFESIQKGFLNAEMLKESVKRLESRVKYKEEELMKAVETLDSMTLEATFQEAKTKKKNLTGRILKLHDDAEKLGQSICEYKSNKT